LKKKSEIENKSISCIQVSEIENEDFEKFETEFPILPLKKFTNEKVDNIIIEKNENIQFNEKFFDNHFKNLPFFNDFNYSLSSNMLNTFDLLNLKNNSTKIDLNFRVYDTFKNYNFLNKN
jgi:3-hydroxymyristoyl/3-hydroxydecanoyl-(acyl carrier protein) dehydratase